MKSSAKFFNFSIHSESKPGENANIDHDRFKTELVDKVSLSSLIWENIRTSWWVVLFLLICYITYEQTQKSLHQDYVILSDQLDKLNSEKQQVISIQRELRRQLNSQNDPAWIELLLMRELGLTPEGHTKVYFY